MYWQHRGLHLLLIRYIDLFWSNRDLLYRSHEEILVKNIWEVVAILTVYKIKLN